MADRNLQELLDTVESPVDLLRNQQTGPNVYPGVPAEYTNWRDEQQAWQQTCVLFNQSYHMAELTVEGPDALTLLSSLGVNSFNELRAQQGQAVRAREPDGYVIGDVILFYLAENQFNLVGRAPVINWVEFPRRRPAATTSRSSATSAPRCAPTGGASHYRFQLQGPNAMKIIEKALGARARGPQVLQHGADQIAGVDGPRAAPRHGRPAGLRAVRTVGRRRGGPRGAGRGRQGLRPAARRRPRLLANTLESGWIPSPLPAVYTGDRDEGLPRVAAGRRLRGQGSIGGSFVPAASRTTT